MSDFKKIILFSFFLAIFISSAYAQGPSPDTADFRGFVRIDGAIAANDTPVSAVINNGSTLVATTSVYSVVAGAGFYQLNVPGTTGDKINFKVCGVDVSLPSLSWALGSYRNGSEIYINLSISTSANGVACTYACGCSGGYCNSGVCASSAPTTGGTPGGTTGGGTPAGGAPSGTTTATTPAPVTETETVTKIENGTSTTFNITKSDSLKIESINVEVKNTVNNVQITVKESSLPAGANAAISSAQGAVYKYLEITKVNIQDADISKVKIKFKVEKSWADANNIDVSTIALNRLVGNSWTKLTTTLTGQDATYYYFESESSGLSIFAITGVKKPSPTTSVTSSITTTTTSLPLVIPGTTQFYVVIFIGILVLLVLAYFVLKRPKKSEYGQHPQT